ncbi:MAG: hypothetical protein WD844_16620 [Thermoleophilaceae bacterium]
MLTRRTQILLDEERYERLRRRAERDGESVAAVVRTAIDGLLDDDDERRRRAAASFLAAEPMPVDDWPVMKREIEEMYERTPGLGEPGE